MKYLSWIPEFLRQATTIVVCLFTLGACSTDKSTPAIPVDVIEVVEEPIVVVEPIISGSAPATQAFVVAEDEILRGQFHSGSAPAAGPVTVRSLPVNGTLLLQQEGTVFLYTPNENYSGTDVFTYLTFENQEIDVFVNIKAVNDAPTISANLPRVTEQGRDFYVQLEAYDVDSEELQFSSSGLPSWLQLDAASGRLEGIPGQPNIGITNDITFRVTDNQGLFTELTGLQIEVVDINDAPTLNLEQLPAELNGRQTVTADLFPHDLDGDTVTLTVESGAFVESSVNSGAVTLTAADVSQVTDVNLIVIATDDQGLFLREIIPITIYPKTVSGVGLTVLGNVEGRGVHLVLLGDGYSSEEQDLFREHVDLTVAQIANDVGVGDHLAAFNVHMILTVSEDSGADNNEQEDTRNTVFDSTYNCDGILRLICANTLTMFEIALSEFPSADQIVLLVNDTRYGGSGNSGGSVAITSAYFPEIALHEMGHSLVGLADEYVDTLIRDSSGLLDFPEGRYRNVTALTDPALVPWAHWIESFEQVPQQAGDLGVGLFEGGFYRADGVFRPTFNSRMRTFDAPFGAVNSELWILRLYRLTEGIRSVLPSSSALSITAGESQEFIVNPIFTDDIQAVEWMVNGEIQAVAEGNPNKLTISPAVGVHTVSLTVRDITGKIKLPPPHAGIFNLSWELEVK